MKKTTSRARPRRPTAKGAENKAHAGSQSGGLKTSSRAMRKEIEELRRRLEIAEMTLNAIRSGEADALVISGHDGDSVFTLKGADQPYRVLVESMNEGAVTVTPDGVLLYSNRHFADLIGRPLENVMGASLYDAIPMGEHAKLDALLRQGKTGARVVIPVGAPLKAALDAAQKHGPLILANSLRRPWTSHGFQTSWRIAATKAGIVGVTFHDLRGTAVTRLAIVDCTEAQIASITGHSLRDVRSILDANYLHRDPALAIRKLERGA